VVDAESAPLEQIVGQLNKLINVVAITDLAPKDALERELLLATVVTDGENRGRILGLVEMFNASIVDVDARSLTLMLAGTPGTCDDLEKAMESFAEVELHRTGRVALPRLTKTEEN
jgi:acetolactate synthase-1/3 small subunit